MRTRLIRPEFFSDSRLADLTDACRLFYIGLWCVADDAGYFDWDLRAIAAELYRYRDDGERLEQAVNWSIQLIELDRIQQLPCGRHGLIPTVATHRMKGGRPTFPTLDKHERTCLHMHERAATNGHVPGSGSGSGSGSLESESSQGMSDPSRASAHEGEARLPKRTDSRQEEPA